jgi:hypothetical protein
MVLCASTVGKKKTEDGVRWVKNQKASAYKNVIDLG